MLFRSLPTDVLRLLTALGLRVVAEGVEDEASWRELARGGCDVVQGYVLTPPLAAPALRDWLDEYDESRWAQSSGTDVVVPMRNQASRRS